MAGLVRRVRVGLGGARQGSARCGSQGAVSSGLLWIGEVRQHVAG